MVLWRAVRAATKRETMSCPSEAPASALSSAESALRTEVRAWQGDVLNLVSSQGAQRRTAARMASFGVNGAGLAVMLLVVVILNGVSKRYGNRVALETLTIDFG